jgi:DNA-binding response OmpR family regulator
VETAADLATALKLAGEQTFDLLLSDLGLPDGSGVDLIRTLRGRGDYTVAIALSGYGQEEDVRASLAAGFTAHLTKPLDPERLLNTIRPLFDSPD